MTRVIHVALGATLAACGSTSNQQSETLVRDYPAPTTQRSASSETSGSQSASSEAASSKRRISTEAPFPSAVMGVSWGMSPRQVADVCGLHGGRAGNPEAATEQFVTEMAGRQAVSEGASAVLCTSLPAVFGWKGQFSVRFYETRACEVMVFPAHNDVADAVKIWRKLVDKYGYPHLARATFVDGGEEIAADFADHGGMRACFQGAVQVRHEWFFADENGGPGNLRLNTQCNRGKASSALFYRDELGIALRQQEFRATQEVF